SAFLSALAAPIPAKPPPRTRTRGRAFVASFLDVSVSVLMSTSLIGRDAPGAGGRLPGLVRPLGHRPGNPTHETVDRVAVLGLGECELIGVSGELERTVLDPVRPGHQHLAPPGAALLVDRVAVQEVVAVRGVGAKAGAELHDDGALIAGVNLELL